jgi:hypothetical protein
LSSARVNRLRIAGTVRPRSAATRACGSPSIASGTTRVVDLAPGREPGVMSLPVCGAGNRLFLAATDGVSGLEPWISDGTAAGTYG